MPKPDLLLKTQEIATQFSLKKKVHFFYPGISQNPSTCRKVCFLKIFAFFSFPQNLEGTGEIEKVPFFPWKPRSSKVFFSVKNRSICSNKVSIGRFQLVPNPFLKNCWFCFLYQKRDYPKFTKRFINFDTFRFSNSFLGLYRFDLVHGDLSQTHYLGRESFNQKTVVLDSCNRRMRFRNFQKVLLKLIHFDSRTHVWP